MQFHYVGLEPVDSINVYPGYPVAAAKRGRQVNVSSQNTFAVGDHDFCKFSFIPSVTLLVDIPERIECSWYSGQVFVGIKDAAFEPSSQLRHAMELYNCLVNRMEGQHTLFVHSDGGPEHRLTYASVQISLIALFLNLDLGLLIAGRTAPSHSWANPVERIMSIVNLGMQCIGVMREKMGDEFEKAVTSAKDIKVLSAKFYFHKPITVHLELYLFYCFIHFVLYIGQY